MMGRDYHNAWVKQYRYNYKYNYYMDITQGIEGT
jgi:hypothetical protein